MAQQRLRVWGAVALAVVVVFGLVLVQSPSDAPAALQIVDTSPSLRVPADGHGAAAAAAHADAPLRSVLDKPLPETLCALPADLHLKSGRPLARLNSSVHVVNMTTAEVAEAFQLVQRHCAAVPIRVFLTYADGPFVVARRRIVREAAATGTFDIVVEFDRADIDAQFMADNAAILTQKRGGGYWLPKIWSAHAAMAVLRDGDFLVYLDAGCLILRSPQPWLETVHAASVAWAAAGATNASSSSSNGRAADPSRPAPPWLVLVMPREMINAWTKGDVFDALGVSPQSTEGKGQLLGGIWATRKTSETAAIAEEWLRYGCVEQLITDAPSIVANPPGFIEHRHDQAILTLLMVRHRVYGHPSLMATDNTYPEADARRNNAIVAAARSRTR